MITYKNVSVIFFLFTQAEMFNGVVWVGTRSVKIFGFYQKGPDPDLQHCRYTVNIFNLSEQLFIY